jgi:organic radical activating enzyme
MLAHRYVLFLTEKCNLKCFYCDIGQLEVQRDPDPELLYHYFPKINGRDDIVKKFTLTGGEPALAPYEMLEYIFTNIAKCQDIQVNTNGLFIEKGYFEKWYDKIDYVGYHSCIEVGEDINPYIEDCKITIYQPIHRKSLPLIKDMCRRYNKLRFNLIPMLTKYMFNNYEDYILRTEDYEWLFKELQDVDNVEFSTLLGLYYSSKYTEEQRRKHRIICGNSHTHPTIDFVNKVIRRCPISYTFNDTVPLTDENFEKLMEFKLFRDASLDVSCMSCNDFPRYYSSYINNYLETAIKTCGSKADEEFIKNLTNKCIKYHKKKYWGLLK